MKNKKRQTASCHFPFVPLTEAVDSRTGKHAKIVSEILSDLEKLDKLSAIKVALSETGEKKADLRSALHRAAKKSGMTLATTSDEKHLYVFQKFPPAR
ncbi:MAG: hypothetical protein ABSF97_20125 [Candidatus Sulfotelmatobacter sp.]|jgi:hypothetical protein